MKLWPRSLFGRLLLLMSAGLLVAQLAGSLLQSWDRQRTLGHTVSHELAQRIASIYRVVDAQTGPQRQPMATLLSTPSLQIHIVDAAPPPAVAAPSMLDDLPGHIIEVLGQRADVTIEHKILRAFIEQLVIALSQ